MPTRVLLIRHGETIAHAEDVFAGATDLPLSDIGREHVEGLATRLKAFDLKAIYASPLQRTLQTARIIAELHFLDVIPVPDLREVNHGHWEGLSRAEVEKKFPEEYAEYERDPFHFHPQGGETGQAVIERAAPALLEIVRDNPHAEVAVVSHKATNRLLIGHFLGIDLRGYRDKLGQRAACLNILDFTSDTQAKLMLMDDVSHYTICAAVETQYVV